MGDTVYPNPNPSGLVKTKVEKEVEVKQQRAGKDHKKRIKAENSKLELVQALLYWKFNTYVPKGHLKRP